MWKPSRDDDSTGLKLDIQSLKLVKKFDWGSFAKHYLLPRAWFIGYSTIFRHNVIEHFDVRADHQQIIEAPARYQ
jgi:hypothetical protein